jgi:hypothetical protein
MLSIRELVSKAVNNEQYDRDCALYVYIPKLEVFAPLEKYLYYMRRGLLPENPVILKYRAIEEDEGFRIAGQKTFELRLNHKGEIIKSDGGIIFENGPNGVYSEKIQIMLKEAAKKSTPSSEHIKGLAKFKN